MWNGTSNSNGILLTPPPPTPPTPNTPQQQEPNTPNSNSNEKDFSDTDSVRSTNSRDETNSSGSGGGGASEDGWGNDQELYIVSEKRVRALTEQLNEAKKQMDYHKQQTLQAFQARTRSGGSSDNTIKVPTRLKTHLHPNNNSSTRVGGGAAAGNNNNNPFSDVEALHVQTVPTRRPIAQYKPLYLELLKQQIMARCGLSAQETNDMLTDVLDQLDVRDKVAQPRVKVVKARPTKNTHVSRNAALLAKLDQSLSKVPDNWVPEHPNAQSGGGTAAAGVNTPPEFPRQAFPASAVMHTASHSSFARPNPPPSFTRPNPPPPSFPARYPEASVPNQHPVVRQTLSTQSTSQPTFNILSEFGTHAQSLSRQN